MRLGFAIAPKEMVGEMGPFALSSISSVVKYGGVAALKDTAYEAKMKAVNKQLRDRTTAELKSLGWETIPSDANFFMVNLKTDMGPVQQQFEKKNVLVGRRFSPMDNWLRVSVGSDDEMKRFVAAFKEIFPSGPPPTKPTTAASAGA
jgi:histidinol-phosphate aminotransferase